MWNLFTTLCLKVLHDELWMYKSDSDGFFSNTVVYRPYIIVIFVIALLFLKLRIMDHMDLLPFTVIGILAKYCIGAPLPLA